MASSVIRDLLVLLDRPDVISFAGGIPDDALFPVDAVAGATDRVLRADPGRALQYGPTQGDPGLRDWIAARMRARGVDGCTAEHVLITSGSQQALDLIGRLIVAPGRPVAVEQPSYLGALQSFRAYEAGFRSISDADGALDPDRLAPADAAPPSLAYVVSDFANPTGATLTRIEREALLAAAGAAGTAIIEDAAYTDLRYEGRAEPPILALDTARAGSLDRTRTLHCGSFSKILVPGLRIGFVCAGRPVIDRLVRAKQAADLHTATLNQLIVADLAATVLDDHLPRLISAYRSRRDTLLDALSATMPPGVGWSRPSGGMFVWLRLPEGLDTTALLTEAVEDRKVAFIPGGAFAIDPTHRRHARLSFTLGPDARIREGVSRLADLLSARLAEGASSPKTAATPPPVAAVG
jgi:DNA-binding transcriptional MocR family regulator